MNTKAMRRVNKSSHSELPIRGNYGSALSNVSFGIEIATPDEFSMILTQLDEFMNLPIEESSPKSRINNNSNLNIPSISKNKGKDFLNSVVAKGHTKNYKN